VLKELRIMSFRAAALASVALLLCASALRPVSAQPQVPVRPRYTTFQNLFYPGQQPLLAPGGGFLRQMGPFAAQGGPIGAGVGGAPPQVPGFVLPGSLLYPQNQPPVFVDPALAPTGVVGRFNYLGHWYGANSISGGLDHWYPNGPANGRGVLGFGAGYGSGGLYAAGIGPTTGGFGAAGSPQGAAPVNQPRR
jgi:hypothetical protein